MAGTTFQGLQYTARTGLAKLDVANTYLDGYTGTIFHVITAARQGTLIKTIIIKAITDTTLGMVRLFVKTNNIINLLTEIPVSVV